MANVSPRPADGRLTIPRLRRTFFARPRLIAKLQEGLGEGLTVVVAPAGYGKTTLLASFARELDEYAPRWLSLDSSCRSAEVFCGQLVACLEGKSRATPASVARNDDLRLHLAASGANAAAESDRPLLIVIDNIHELRGADAACELLDWFIQNCPRGFEVVLSGREAASIGSVDRILAAGETTFVGAADLAFTEAEVDQLLRQAGSDLPAPPVREATRGWPVAVAAIASGSVSLLGQLAARTGSWERYLVTEVWCSVPEELQPLLLRLSLPSEVHPGEGAEAVGALAWRRLWAWMQEREFLVEPLGPEGFRLNPLFHQFLRAEFARQSPALYAADAGAVVRRMARQGQVDDAIELAREAGLTGILVELLQEHGRRLIYQGAYNLLWRGYEAIPPDRLEALPALRGVRARLLAHLDRPREALAEADAILSTEADESARLHAVLARVRALRLLGEYEALRTAFIELPPAPEHDDAAIAAELAYHQATFELAVTRDLPRASGLLRETVRICDSDAVEPLGLLARSSLGQLHVVSGDGPRAVTELTAAAAGWRRWGSTANLGWVLNNLGMGYCLVGDFATAVAVLDEARREAALCGNRRLEAYVTASLADAELALGQHERARVRYEEAVRLCGEGVADESLAALAVAGLSAAILKSGDVPQADFFIQRAVIIAEKLGNPYELAFCRMQESAVRGAARDHDAAIRLAQEAVALFASIDSRTPLRQAHYRLALACFQANRRHEAQEVLGRLNTLITEPWMAGALKAEVRDAPMFAQWAASRNLAGQAFREMIEHTAFAPDDQAGEPLAITRLPRITARSLGPVQVAVGGREVTDEAWASNRSRELFFLFLARRGGLRKEDAVEELYPELPAERTNSAFHSNVYRIRKALYPESIVRRDGTYLLNPDAEFDWDVEAFERAISLAERLPAGSEERARRYEEALALYRGPFAEVFFSEWAAGLRMRLADRSDRSLAALAGYYASRQEFEAAVGCMERVLAHDRFNEEAAYQLATFQVDAGQRVAAVAFIDDFRTAYEAEFGEQLPERFIQLRSRIAAGAI